MDNVFTDTIFAYFWKDTFLIIIYSGGNQGGLTPLKNSATAMLA